MLESIVNGPAIDYMQRGMAAANLRQEVISNNVANVNTPRFKKSDVVFEELLAKEIYGDPEDAPKWKKMGILAVEMEAAALYTNAIQAGKKALAILTISDIVLGGTPVETTAEERETKFTDMMKMALSLA